MNETVEGRRGMVVAPHRDAAEAGAAILREGGNAVEAMIAAAATIAVVYPHMNSIGGDAFWLIAQPGKATIAIDASGAAGSLATIESYRREGIGTVPRRGPRSALTVAGTVSGWSIAAEVAQRIGGTIPRRDLLADAIKKARDGYRLGRSPSRTIADSLDILNSSPLLQRIYAPAGRPAPLGWVVRMPRLADALDRLADAGYDDFYRGDVARLIADDLASLGCPVLRSDLESHRGSVAAPLTLSLRDCLLSATPVPTQGIATLLILGIFDRLNVTKGESFDHFHGIIEATKRAYRVRNAEVCDPASARDLSPYLTASWLDEQARSITTTSLPARASPPGGDTVWLGAIDSNGVAVSFIQSIYLSFGSGVLLPKTEILWHNRGLDFSLDPASRNRLAPGRKPFHTLAPALAQFNDGRSVVFGTMGGHGQPQTLAQLFTRYARFGADPGTAIDAPLFQWRSGGSHNGGIVAMEGRVDRNVARELEHAGHMVQIHDQPYRFGMAHAGMIVRRPDGVFLGASDPRCDGAAVAA